MIDRTHALSVPRQAVALGISRGAVYYVRNTGVALSLLSRVMREEGDFDRAEALATESLDLRRAINDRHGVAESLATLALAAVARADEARARALFTESLSARRTIGDRAGIAECERELTALASAE